MEISLVLSKANPLTKNGYPIKIYIYEDRKSRHYISTGYYSQIADWDINKVLPKSSHPSYRAILDYIYPKQLQINNNKPWFDANRKPYELAKANYSLIVQFIINELSKLDSRYGELKISNCTFRINRDVRFSKNKDPYKNNFGAGFTIGGKKSTSAGFYFHVQPGACFAAGGLWMPEPEALKKIRQEMDYNFPAFRKIITNKKFAELVGELSQENKLVNPPKGYEINNPAVEFLKLKSFVVSHAFSDKEVLENGFEKQLIDTFKIIAPFVSFLNQALDT